MKRSRTITLSLIATISLGIQGCGSKQETRRELYATKQQCLEDWGSEQECEENRSTGHYHGPHYFYRGGRPFYFPRSSNEPLPLSDRAGFSRLPEGAYSSHSLGRMPSTHISRGGFGRSGFFHGSGS